MDYDAYGSPTKWTVMLDKKRRCDKSVCTCAQIEEKYVRTDNQTVYLQDQTTRTPSLANPPIQTTLTGTPFTSPLQPEYGIPLDQTLWKGGESKENTIAVIPKTVLPFLDTVPAIGPHHQQESRPQGKTRTEYGGPFVQIPQRGE